jgi:hypothetical protein
MKYQTTDARKAGVFELRLSYTNVFQGKSPSLRLLRERRILHGKKYGHHGAFGNKRGKNMSLGNDKASNCQKRTAALATSSADNIPTSGWM